MKGRRLILNYPPVSSPWHLPVGTSWLAATLRAEGHTVLQRYGHILGLEHVLRACGGKELDSALLAVRSPSSDISSLYEARLTLERVSQSIPTKDAFVVERNNVRYAAANYDGTVQSLLRCIRNRNGNIWHDYFAKVEVPMASAYNPELYGISINDERQLVPGCILAAMVKEALPKTIVVLGGNIWPRVKHVFANSEFAALFDYCDAIVYPEGFEPLVSLAAQLEPRNTFGVVWREGQKLVVNPKPVTAKPFESLPTPQFDGGENLWGSEAVFPLYTISNCPFQCSYCGISGGSDTYRQRPRLMSSSRIVEHMATLARDTGRFDFFDETLSISRQIALGKALQKVGMMATWQCYLTITKDMLDPGLCRRLYEAGCRAVQLGLETLSDESLSRENKKWNHPEAYGQILRNLKDAGIQVHAFIIAGIPGERISDTLRWLPFLEKYGDSILTIKVTRYRLTRTAPEEQEGTLSPFIEELPDTAPLRLNRDFRYKTENGRSGRKDVEAVRTLLEEACRRHWAYGVTSTIPWWTNRGRYTLDELREMGKSLPKEPETPHLPEALKRAGSIIAAELGVKAKFTSFEELSNFFRDN